MKYCTNCGNKLVEGSNYCGNCGKKVAITKSDEASVHLENDVLNEGDSNYKNEYHEKSEEPLYINISKNKLIEPKKNIKLNAAYAATTLLSLVLLWGSINGLINIIFFNHSLSVMGFGLIMMFIAILVRRFSLKKLLGRNESSKIANRIIITEVSILVTLFMSPVVMEIITGYTITDLKIVRSLVFIIAIFVYYRSSQIISKNVDSKIMMLSSIFIFLMSLLFSSKFYNMLFGIDMELLPGVQLFSISYVIISSIILAFEAINYYESLETPTIKDSIISVNDENDEARVESIDKINKEPSSKKRDNTLVKQLVMIIVYILMGIAMIFGFGIAQSFGRDLAKVLFGI